MYDYINYYVVKLINYIYIYRENVVKNLLNVIIMMFQFVMLMF